MKVLQVALERQDYNLAAHVLVYALVKTKVEEKKLSLRYLPMSPSL